MKRIYLRIWALALVMAMLAAYAPGMAAAEASDAAATPAPEAVTRQTADDADKWDLTEYFADDAAFDAELKTLKNVELAKYKKMAEGVKDADTLLAFKQYSDAVSERLRHLSCYAQQKGDLNAADATATTQDNAVTLLWQDFSLVDTALTNRLLAMDEAFWTAVEKDERLEPYRRELTKMREAAAYTLSEAEETLLMPAQQATSNIMRTFDMLSYGSIQWPTVTGPDGNEVTANYTNYLKAMAHPDRAYRKAFYEAYAGTYGQYRDTFASNLNAFIALSEQSATQHHYESTLDEAMQTNDLTVEIYDALMEAGRNSTDVLKREGELRKAVMGIDELYIYDSRMPLGNAKAPTFTYAEAQQLIKSALAPLGQEYVDTLDLAFTSRWIDAYPDANKATGAYSGMGVDIHPWVLTNFTGDYYSMTTLAHELGHALHQYRSDATQKSAYGKNPTSLVTEVASTFNEQLLSRFMIEHAKSDEEKLYYVQQELETLRNTFFGQLSFADFERQFHKLAENGEALTADALDALYTENNSIYSPAYSPVEATASYWAGVPHFYYNYYVYSYAMAISVSCVAADAIAGGDADMLERYLTFLSAGDSADSVELFRALGVDVTKPNYTKPLMERYSELLDLEEELLGLKK